MPYIAINTSQALTPQDKTKIKSDAGRLISLIPTKQEKHLMVQVNDSQFMTFGGSQKPTAYIALHLYTAAPQDDKRNFVEQFIEAISPTLQVPPEDIFVNIVEHDHWGSGGTFR